MERVIGMIRQKYTMLQSTFPINMLMCEEGETESTLDKVVTVCCALCNCCDSGCTSGLICLVIILQCMVNLM